MIMKRIEKKAADEVIIVRLRCKFPVKCDRDCNKEAVDIAIKESDLVYEGSRRRRKVHFKNTLTTACGRLNIDPEKIFCDKHNKGDIYNENSNYVNVTISNDAKNAGS